MDCFAVNIIRLVGSARGGTAAFFSSLDPQKDATSEERTDDYACLSRAMAEGLTAHFTRYFARALPTNSVIRLPFWCRWKAASADFGEDWCPIRLVIAPN